MPSGTFHEMTGQLLRIRDEFRLLVDGGLMWTVSLPHAAEKLVGRRVYVVGCRDEDGWLFVQEARPL